jgi:hypothetical protein
MRIDLVLSLVIGLIPKGPWYEATTCMPIGMSRNKWSPAISGPSGPSVSAISGPPYSYIPSPPPPRQYHEHVHRSWRLCNDMQSKSLQTPSPLVPLVATGIKRRSMENQAASIDRRTRNLYHNSLVSHTPPALKLRGVWLAILLLYHTLYLQEQRQVWKLGS